MMMMMMMMKCIFLKMRITSVLEIVQYRKHNLTVKNNKIDGLEGERNTRLYMRLLKLQFVILTSTERKERERAALGMAKGNRQGRRIF